MKFNFENFGKKATDKVKKVGLPIAMIFGTAGALSAQENVKPTQSGVVKTNEAIEYLNKVAVDFPEQAKDTYQIKKSDKANFEYREGLQKQTDSFFNKLDSLGLIPEGMDEYTFANLTKPEHEDYIAKYMKKTGAITREELPPGDYEVIAVRKNDVGKKSVHETRIPGAEEFDFDTWFEEQIALGNEGDEVLAPNGKLYLIKINKNAKSNNIAKSTTEKTPRDGSDVVISETVNRVNMADLHKGNQGSSLDK